jgi:hypothetical protein
MGFGRRRGGRAECTVGEEEREGGVETVAGGMGRIRVVESVKEAGGCENKVGFFIRAADAFLALDIAAMDGENAGIVFARVIYEHWIAERRFGIQEMVGTGGE